MVMALYLFCQHMTKALKAYAFRAFSCQNVSAVVLPVVFDAPPFDALQIFLCTHINNNYRRDALNDAQIS